LNEAGIEAMLRAVLRLTPDQLRKVLERAFAALPDVRVLVYEPAGAPAAEQMTRSTDPPRMTAVLKEDTELFKQFVDNPDFKRWLADTVFAATYDRPAAP
jgi:hypothetical protein